MAALGVTWKCQLCAGNYVLLRDLVSHVRACHSSEDYICGLQGCLRKTNTWYKHVIDSHHDEYDEYLMDHSGLSDHDESSDQSEDKSESDLDSEEDCVDGINEGSSEYCPEEDRIEPAYVNENAVVGRLIMIKENHRLSQAAVDDIVQLV